MLVCPDNSTHQVGFLYFGEAVTVIRWFKIRVIVLEQQVQPRVFINFELRGGSGVLVVLKGDAKQFEHLTDRLHIGSSTLTKRLGEAKEHGVITPEVDNQENSVTNRYRLTERGQYVVTKMERMNIVRAYRTMLDMQAQIEDGKTESLEWVQLDETKEELARQSDSDPFGNDMTEFANDDENRDYDEFLTKERFSENVFQVRFAELAAQ